MTHRDPPPATALNGEQYAGRACCWCGKRLWDGAVSAGIARGRAGAHVLDIEVYACPDCHTTQTPVRPAPRTAGGRTGATASHPRQPPTTGGTT